LIGIKRAVVSLVLIVLALVVSVLVAYHLVTTKPLPARQALAPHPPLVRVLPLVERDIEQTFVGYGSARADRQATLAAEVAGEVVEIGEGINDGSEVRQGQVLLRIDRREYEQRLAAAQHGVAELDAELARLDVEEQNIRRLMAIARREVDVNEDEYNRLSTLYEKGEASKTEFNFARLAYDRSLRESEVLGNRLALIEPGRASARAARAARLAEAELARLQVERCRIVAPFDGQISELMVEVGDRVMPGTPVARVTCLDVIEVPVELPVSVRPEIATGAACVLTVDSNPSLSWKGKVDRLAPVADERSRTFAAYVEVDNRVQSTPLIPGYFLAAQVRGPLLAGVLAVPRGAIVNDSLFVVNGDCAHERRVHVDTVVGEIAVVSGEIGPGDLVVLTNLDKLYDGAPVRLQSAGGELPVPADSSAAPGASSEEAGP
jgi:multidrug resistance efflux pump